jgi:hypothetical protein
MVQSQQKMFGGFFVRFKVDADNSDIISSADEARLDLQSSLISTDSL